MLANIPFNDLLNFPFKHPGEHPGQNLLNIPFYKTCSTAMFNILVSITFKILFDVLLNNLFNCPVQHPV
jgi:hypothetical protein